MYIGVDIGGSKILVAAGNDQHEILRSQKIHTPKDGNQGMAEIIHLIEQVADGDSIRAISIACAGPLDRHKGMILRTSPNMHGWRGTRLVEPIKNHFKLPVVLTIDPAAAAVTESQIGAAQNQPYVLYITISTGIGVSLVVNRELYQGEHNLEAGHIILDPDGPPCGCGGRGHFESMSSGPAIKKRFGKEAYEIKDPAVWDEIAATMALGFHSIIEAYSPSIVVVGGGVGVHYDQFHAPLVKHLEQLTPMFSLPPIVQAKYIETGVVHGALILAARSAV
jgi:glucokinase